MRNVLYLKPKIFKINLTLDFLSTTSSDTDVEDNFMEATLAAKEEGAGSSALCLLQTHTQTTQRYIVYTVFQTHTHITRCYIHIHHTVLRAMHKNPFYFCFFSAKALGPCGWTRPK